MSIYTRAQEPKIQKMVRKACEAGNLGKMLTAQGKAKDGAKMQVVTLLVIGHIMEREDGVDPLSGLAGDIFMTVKERVTRYGREAYPMSEKQIEVVERDIMREWRFHRLLKPSGGA